MAKTVRVRAHTRSCKKCKTPGGGPPSKIRRSGRGGKKKR